MENEVYVDLKMRGDWITMTYRTRIFRDWLTEKNITFLEHGLSSDGFPHGMVMKSDDALAFKLKFGL